MDRLDSIGDLLEPDSLLMSVGRRLAPLASRRDVRLAGNDGVRRPRALGDHRGDCVGRTDRTRADKLHPRVSLQVPSSFLGIRPRRVAHPPANFCRYDRGMPPRRPYAACADP